MKTIQELEQELDDRKRLEQRLKQQLEDLRHDAELAIDRADRRAHVAFTALIMVVVIVLTCELMR